MNWTDRAEARFGHFGVPGLLRYVAMLNGLVFLLYKLQPETVLLLDLVPERVMAGEVWRLFTYIFIPRWGWLFPDWLGVAIYMMFLWWLGDGLEHAMGTFKLTLFYVLGMIGTTIAAFFFGAHFSNAMLHNSLFLAFARFFPETWIYILFILPVKIKWLAWINAAFLMVGFLFNTNSYRMALLAALLNFFVFFGRDLFREAVHRQSVASRRRDYAKRSRPESEALHKCAVCERTEVSNPELDFRVARDGEEYCTEHLPKAQPGLSH